MSGPISAGGLITGLDSESLIRSLLQLERQPINRLQQRIGRLEKEQEAVRGLRTTLQTLRNSTQDFRFNDIFDSFAATSSTPEVLKASITSDSPVTGAFAINVQQLATATQAVSDGFVGGPIDTGAALDSSGITKTITAGEFFINGVQFSVDPAADSLDDLLSAINGSAAGVTATYDATSDTVSIANSTAGDGSFINFGSVDSTSNLLNVLNLSSATQSPDGGGTNTVTSTRNLGAIDPAVALNSSNFRDGAVTAGTFSVNGIAIAVDPATQSIYDVLRDINESDAGVTANYDTATDTIRVVSDTLGSPTVNFGSAGDTSNFLDVVNLDTAVQTAGKDTQFTVNGGPVQTRNSNTVDDAIGGVSLNLQSVGASTVNVSNDDDATVEEISGFVEAFNTALSEIRNLTGSEGALRGDGGIRAIGSFLLNNIFDRVSGLNGDFESLLDIGISGGDDFNAETGLQLNLNEERFRAALQSDRANVRDLFANDGKTGIADTLFEFLDATAASGGFLHQRARSNGSLDQQIQTANDQIARIEDRLLMKENRLRRQFTNLEQLSAGFQNQASALSGIGRF